MNKNIFISYTESDIPFALQLADDLSNAGVRIWLHRLHGTGDATTWRDEIEQAMNDCLAVIVILTPAYLASEDCRKELMRADSLRRPILPILLEDILPEQAPLILEDTLWEDFRHWRDIGQYAPKLQQLVDRIDLTAFSAGQLLDIETRILNQQIADLKQQRGVMTYIDLDIKVQNPTSTEDIILPPDEWGFHELVQTPRDKTSHPDTNLVNTLSDAIGHYAGFVLIGQSGMGKTTVLRRLVYEAAQRRLRNRQTASYPLLLYLAQWADDQSFEAFLYGQWRFNSDPVPFLQAGTVSLYIDGLNEMGANGQHKAIHLRDWLKQKSINRVILTCRATDYVPDIHFDTLPVMMLQDLSHKQIRQFSERYLHDEADSFLDYLMEPRFYGHSLGRLARQPYMLSALIFIYQNVSKEDLFPTFDTFFQRLLRALWHRESMRGTVGTITLEALEAYLSHLAFYIMQQAQPTISWQSALAIVGDEAFLHLGINASLLASEGDQLRFYDVILREYFTMLYLRQHWQTHVWDAPRFQGGQRIPGQWDSVTLALIDSVDNPYLIIEKLIQQDGYLALTCLENVPFNENAPVELLNEWLLTLIQNPEVDTIIRQRSLTQLMDFYSEGATEKLLPILYGDDAELRAKVAYVLAKFGAKALDTLLMNIPMSPEETLPPQLLLAFQQMTALDQHLIAYLDEPSYRLQSARLIIFLMEEEDEIIPQATRKVLIQKLDEWLDEHNLRDFAVFYLLDMGLTMILTKRLPEWLSSPDVLLRNLAISLAIRLRQTDATLVQKVLTWLGVDASLSKQDRKNMIQQVAWFIEEMKLSPNLANALTKYAMGDQLPFIHDMLLDACLINKFGQNSPYPISILSDDDMFKRYIATLLEEEPDYYLLEADAHTTPHIIMLDDATINADMINNLITDFQKRDGIQPRLLVCAISEDKQLSSQYLRSGISAIIPKAIPKEALLQMLTNLTKYKYLDFNTALIHQEYHTQKRRKNTSEINILIADDVLETRETFRKLLAFESDFRIVAIVGSGIDAILQARATSPDVALIDVNMSDVSGFDASFFIRSIMPDMQIILMSVRPYSEIIAEVSQSNIQYVIEKPPNMDALYSTIYQAYRTSHTVYKNNMAILIDKWIAQREYM